MERIRSGRDSRALASPFTMTTIHRVRDCVHPLRLVGLLEGVSFLVLLGIAMPLKHFAGRPEAVRVVGMAHGVLFILFVVLVLIVARQRRWGAR